MKKIFIILVMVAFTTSSCEDFLNTEPTDKIALEQYYGDEAGLTSALAGVYDPLASVHNNVMLKDLAAVTDENFYARSGQTTGVVVNIFNAADSGIANLWNALYAGVNRANILIANINVPKMDESKRQVILGEALFLRGYYYFILVSNFGDVPLRVEPTTAPENLDMARTPSAQVYAQIEKDMKDAELKVQADKYDFCGRVSKTTVQGILARVYLHWAGFPLNNTAKYADASTYAKKVMDNPERGLNVSFNSDPAFRTFAPSIATNTANNAYRQIFINQLQNLYDTREVLWEVEFKGNATDGYNERGPLGAQIGSPPFSNNTLAPTVGWSYGYLKGIPRLFNKYDSTGKDLRRDWVMSTYNYSGTDGSRVAIDISTPTRYNSNTFRDCAKWRREYEAINPKAKNESGINFGILRYADILLMYAEAENQLNSSPTAAAIEAVNQVRRRAYGQTNVSLPYLISDAETATAAAAGKAAFQKFIEDERSRELCFEGLRRSDLIRWNKYVSTMNAVGNEIATNTVNTGLRYGGLGGKSTTDRNVLLPIPSVELLSNKLIPAEDQNPGW